MRNPHLLEQKHTTPSPKDLVQPIRHLTVILATCILCDLSWIANRIICKKSNAPDDNLIDCVGMKERYARVTFTVPLFTSMR